jgi:uncharacterized protein YcfJ
MTTTAKSATTLIITFATLAGCSTKAGTGAVVGGIGGAAVGGLIGSNSHARAGEGAAIGAAIGALGGAAVGHSQDKKDQRKSEEASKQTQPQQPAASTRVTRSDVIEWSQTSVSDDIIIDRIQRSGSTFYLTDADIKQLRDGRVSERVINAMKATAK